LRAIGSVVVVVVEVMVCSLSGSSRLS
jgi:hypothetical protein